MEGWAAPLLMLLLQQEQSCSVGLPATACLHPATVSLSSKQQCGA